MAVTETIIGIETITGIETSITANVSTATGKENIVDIAMEDTTGSDPPKRPKLLRLSKPRKSLKPPKLLRSLPTAGTVDVDADIVEIIAGIIVEIVVGNAVNIATGIVDTAVTTVDIATEDTTGSGRPKRLRPLLLLRLSNLLPTDGMAVDIVEIAIGNVVNIGTGIVVNTATGKENIVDIAMEDTTGRGQLRIWSSILKDTVNYNFD